MSWELIDLETPIEKTVCGRKITIKPLTNGDKMRLVQTMAKFNTDSPEGLDDAISVVSKHILSIEGIDGDPAEAVMSLKSFDTQLEIFKAVAESAALTEPQSGNSNSSPAGSDNSAGLSVAAKSVAESV